MQTELTATAGLLAVLDRRLIALRAALHTGDRAQRPAQAPTSVQLAARGALAAAERWDAQAMAARGLAPIGAGKAPLDLALLDTHRDILLDLAALERAIADRVAPTLAPPSRERLTRRIADLLPLASLLSDLEDHVHSELRRLTWRASAALGDTTPLVRITAMRCPVCSALSLRLDTERDLITCFNAACRCGENLCRCADGRRHAWRPSDLIGQEAV
ncbi:hypothetical protein [Nocardiopsis suaedae]|uniref:Uncharacterized protein n=1 Tax=Nocardiopsis suaedae TaxID=3018444 RepID=A0ABT4TLY9_9ACTN|nr:hypothetical protein [Nocardiopsis suaedae]MDA2805721.1 hypothetical protein [Nocardiopsis suaedae]